MIDFVSVIMPVYNGQEFLSKSVDSVLKQTYRYWELLIIDNGSTDDTLELALSYAQFDSRIKTFNCKERGASFARNVGIANSSGHYIAFLDSDDIWLPRKLEVQIASMKAMDCVLSHTSYIRHTPHNGLDQFRRVKSIETFNTMLENNGMGCSTVVYDARSLGKVYMPNLQKRQDWATWLKILSKGTDIYSLGIDEFLTIYTVRENSISQSNRLGLIVYTFYVYRGAGLGILNSLLRVFVYSLKKLRE